MDELKKKIKNRNIVCFAVGAFFLLLFIIILILVRVCDVEVIGENSTGVGLSSLNKAFYESHNTINELFYKITKYLGYLSFAVIGGFAVVGVIQLIKRKSLLKVDFDILILGAIYIITLALYFFFDFVPVSVRPIIVDEPMEASFPSSHTLMGVVVMGCTFFYFLNNIENKYIKIASMVLSCVFAVLMVVFRLLSGVHWLTDIMAGAFLGISIVSFYVFVIGLIKYRNCNE